MNEPIAKPSKKSGPGWVRLVSDLGPALVFFFTYQWAQKNGVPAGVSDLMAGEAILFATAVFLPAAICRVRFFVADGKEPLANRHFQLCDDRAFLGFSALVERRYFHQDAPTLIYSLMGSILLVSVAVRRNLLKSLFSGAIHMADVHWRTLTVRAGAMYIVLAVINEIVWRTQPEPTWVAYNTWGDVAINMVFWVVNLSLLAKHLTDEHGVPLSQQERQDDGTGFAIRYPTLR